MENAHVKKNFAIVNDYIMAGDNMEFYISLYLIVVFVGFLDLTNTNIRIKKICLSFCALLLTIVSAIRYGVGTDWNAYASFFDSGNEFSDYYGNNTSFEVGYSLLNYIVKNTLNEYNFLLLILSIIVYYCQVKFFCMVSKFPCIVFSLVFSNLLAFLFPVRQVIAIAICMFAVMFAIKRKFFPFILLCIIAITFHKSALIVIPIYWIIKMDFSGLLYGVIVIILSVISYFQLPILLTSYILNMDSSIIIKVLEYSKDQFQTYGSNLSPEVQMFLALGGKGSLLVVFFLLKKYIQNKDGNYLYWFNISAYSYLVYILMVSFSVEIATRSTAFFSYAIYLMIADLVVMNVRINHKLLIYFILCAVSFLHFVYSIYGFYDLYVPYVTVFIRGAL